MLDRVFAVLVLAAGLGGAGSVVAEDPPAPSPVGPIDYTKPANWLCRPGRQDACTVDLDATVIRADGSMSLNRFHPNSNAPIDCFYVYPTVSRDPGVNATMAIEPEEQRAAQQQFARLGETCRLYAPIYRQRTLTALAADMSGQPVAEDDSRKIAYGDVLDAWREYLTKDNHGRGVVLVGHSQGTGILIGLIADEIDGKPVQKHLVSAILMGGDLQVPLGKDVGGTFKHIPLCHSAAQTGCAIAFESFRATSPPPADSLFGQGDTKAGTAAACANPAALGGGSGWLEAYLPTHGVVFPFAGATQPIWTNPPQDIETPFVEVPGLISAECVSDTHGTFLAVTVHPSPEGRRTNDIQGDLLPAQAKWGLHLVDANLTIGNLADVVSDESRAYQARSGE